MKVFVTGGTGLVGESIVPQLVSAGHSVTALARSDASATKLQAMGATPIRGSHTDLEVLGKAASEAEAVIHLAFNHELAFSGQMEQAMKQDREAIEAICEALVKTGPGKTFINTGSTFSQIGPDENSESTTQFERTLSQNLAHSYTTKGVRTIQIRLPPIVYSPTQQHPFIAAQIGVAKQNGSAAFVGDRDSNWSTCHVKDAGALYLLALERGKSGSNYHAVGESVMPTKSIVETIARKLQLPTRSVDADKIAAEGYGPIGHMMGMGLPMTSDLTKKELGWTPKEVGLLEALDTYYTW